MAFSYSNNKASNKQVLTHTYLNTRFDDISNKINTDGIDNTDVSSTAAIAASKIDMSASVGRIAQISSLSSSSPSMIIVNKGSGGGIRIDNTGSGADIFTNGDPISIDLNNDATGVAGTFSVTKNGGANGVFSVASDGTINFPAQTKNHMVQPANFMPSAGVAAGDITFVYDSSASNYYLRNNLNETPASVAAPINIPDSASLGRVTAFYKKTTSTAGLTIKIQKYDVVNDTATVLSTLTTGADSSGTMATIGTTLSTTTDLTNSNYWFNVSIDAGTGGASADMKLYGLRVKYSYTKQ